MSHAATLTDEFRDSAELGLRVRTADAEWLILGDGRPARSCVAAARELGVAEDKVAIVAPRMARAMVAQLGALGASRWPKGVIIAPEDRRGTLDLDALLPLRFAGIPVLDAAQFVERAERRVPLDNVRAADLIFSEGFRLSDWRLALKSTAEWFLALALLVIAAPLIAIAGLAVFAEDGGPIFFVQRRVGRCGSPFRLVKLRSMRIDAEKAGPQFAARDDVRMTRIGRWLRKTRIDELPQLWHVLRGEMALVGPRPERPEFVAEFERHHPYFGLRHQVRPGITGWAQVRCGYASGAAAAMTKLEHDLFYIKHFSLSLDLEIWLRTVGTVVTASGR